MRRISCKKRCRSAAPCEFLFFGKETVQLGHKAVDVLELAVDGSKTHISDLIQRLEPFHNQFADIGGGNLPIERILDDLLDVA